MSALEIVAFVLMCVPVAACVVLAAVIFDHVLRELARQEQERKRP